MWSMQASGRKEAVRYLLWIRICRVRMVIRFFQKLEKDIRINYLFTRIVKLIVVELYCTHTAACIFYYLATTLPASQEGYTWIGSLKLGDDAFTNFRDIDLLKRYLTSLYFAIVTMATVGKLLSYLLFSRVLLPKAFQCYLATVHWYGNLVFWDFQPVIFDQLKEENKMVNLILGLDGCLGWWNNYNVGAHTFSL